MTTIESGSGRRAEEDALRGLIDRVAKHSDRAAFSALFDRMAPRVKSFMLRKSASPELADDLVQDTMVAVWTKAGLFDPSKGSVVTWIFTIARNLRIDRLRSEPAAPFADIDDCDVASEEPTAEARLSAREEQENVASALAAMPEEQRQILILSFVDDVPQSAIAERLSIPLGTVKSRMRLAYGRMRKLLETKT